MTLPASGAISLSQVAAELGIGASGINLNQANVRSLAGGATNMNALRGKSASTPLAASGNDGTAWNQNTSNNGSVGCDISVTVSGGSGGYIYSWVKTSGQGSGSGGATGTLRVIASYSRGSSGQAMSYWNCTITDSQGHQITVTDILADLYWGILV
jgi:hypothetical protein